MKTIKIENKEYNLEFTFEAATYKDLVQAMFNIKSGTYFLKNASDGTETSMLNGVADMISDIPMICKIAFHAGLLENHRMTMEESVKLLKSYMKENKLSFNALFEELNKCMEEDGFFDLSGLTEMMSQMEQSLEEMTEETTTKKKVEMKDHKKKQTSSK